MKQHYQNLKTHCPQNHEYSGDNLYIDPKGHRHCRQCMRARTRKWHREVELPRIRSKRKTELLKFKPESSPTLIDPLFCSWLAGFTDGEGCFFAKIHKDKLNIKYEMKLRADDYLILKEIQSTLGVGTLTYHKRPPDKPTEMPYCRFTIRARMELYQILLPIFDQYPLRAKKKRDYEIWKEIIIIAANFPRQKGKQTAVELKEKLEPLIEKLTNIRNYQEPKL